MTRLDATYRVEQDNLFADLYPPAYVTAVELKGGQGILERGTLIATDENIKNGKPVGSEFNTTTGGARAFYVLCDPVDTGNDEEPVNANAYSSGNFQRDELILADEEYVLTDEDLFEMRRQGIFTQGARSNKKWEDKDE